MQTRIFRRSGLFWVYIVECKNGAFYTGYTNDLKRRLKEHNGARQGARYTRINGPVRLVWCKGYAYYKLAVREERRIKRLRRQQKEKLVADGKRRRQVRKRVAKPETAAKSRAKR